MTRRFQVVIERGGTGYFEDIRGGSRLGSVVIHGISWTHEALKEGWEPYMDVRNRRLYSTSVICLGALSTKTAIAIEVFDGLVGVDSEEESERDAAGATTDRAAKVGSSPARRMAMERKSAEVQTAEDRMEGAKTGSSSKEDVANQALPIHLGLNTTLLYVAYRTPPAKRIRGTCDEVGGGILPHHQGRLQVGS